MREGRLGCVVLCRDSCGGFVRWVLFAMILCTEYGAAIYFAEDMRALLSSPAQPMSVCG